MQRTPLEELLTVEDEKPTFEENSYNSYLNNLLTVDGDDEIATSEELVKNESPTIYSLQNQQKAQEIVDTSPASFTDAPWLETTRAVVGGSRDAAQEIIDWADTGRDFLVSKFLTATGNRVLDFGDDDDEFEFSDLIPTVKQRESPIEDATEGPIF